MQDSTFTKIIRGELPCHKVYEDDLTMAFLDIHPSHHGKTLVITKTQIDQYIDLSSADYTALWQTVHKVARRIRDVLGTDRVGIVIKGTEVPHVHVHLIPFNNNDSLRGDDDFSRVEPNHDELAKLATLLRFN